MFSTSRMGEETEAGRGVWGSAGRSEQGGRSPEHDSRGAFRAEGRRRRLSPEGGSLSSRAWAGPEGGAFQSGNGRLSHPIGLKIYLPDRQAAGVGMAAANRNVRRAEPEPPERKGVAAGAAASRLRASPQRLPGVLPRSGASAAAPAEPQQRQVGPGSAGGSGKSGPGGFGVRGSGGCAACRGLGAAAQGAALARPTLLGPQRPAGPPRARGPSARLREPGWARAAKAGVLARASAVRAGSGRRASSVASPGKPRLEGGRAQGHWGPRGARGAGVGGPAEGFVPAEAAAFVWSRRLPAVVGLRVVPGRQAEPPPAGTGLGAPARDGAR